MTEARDMGGSNRQPVKPMTFAQYRNLPEDMRVELLDGVLVALGSATYRHNDLAGGIYARLWHYLMGKKCRVAQDVTVRFDESESSRNGVRPDINVVCEPEKIRDKIVVGAPKLIVEVLSPSTMSKDMGKKFLLYQAHGVEEYWMVHQEIECIVQCILVDGRYQMKPVLEGTIESTTIEGFAMSIRELYDLAVPPEPDDIVNLD